MQVLQWVLDAPKQLDNAVVVAASSRLTAQNIAFSAVAREAIMRDPDFQGGSYVGTERAPHLGLSIARMMAHITYLSEEGMERKFARARRSEMPMTLRSDYEVEHYLDHQAEIFLARFEPGTYLYMSRVMDYFDPFAEPYPRPSDTRFLVISFSSDWRFGTSHSKHIEAELAARGADVRREEVSSPWGHDSFLMDVPEYHELVRDFMYQDGAGAL
jgi:homoserine O-acetyltransferase